MSESLDTIDDITSKISDVQQVLYAGLATVSGTREAAALLNKVGEMYSLAGIAVNIAARLARVSEAISPARQMCIEGVELALTLSADRALDRLGINRIPVLGSIINLTLNTVYDRYLSRYVRVLTEMAVDNLIYLRRSSNDRISGDYENNYIQSGAGSDYVESKDGDDTIIGGPGNDTIYGGNGSDTIVVSGNNYGGRTNLDGSITFGTYTLRRLSNGNMSLSDSRSSGDGTDILNSVEFIKFNNGQTMRISNFLSQYNSANRQIMANDMALKMEAALGQAQNSDMLSSDSYTTSSSLLQTRNVAAAGIYSSPMSG